MKRFGAAFKRWARPGRVILLRGTLGSGKTTFVQGLARGLGIRGRVSSPTFVLVQTYAGRVPLHHVDLYRLNRKEALELGLEDFMTPDAVTVVEWPERLGYSFFPRHAIRLEFTFLSPQRRRVRVSIPGTNGLN